MNVSKIANILYNMSLGLDYADGIEFAEEEITAITNELQLLKENKADSLLNVLEMIALDNVDMENWHKTVS